MKKKIALLRGINIGGKRKILMVDLKALFEKNGFTNVVTYIQTGNVIFSTPRDFSNIELAVNIEDLIHKHFGFEVPVIVRSVNEWKEMILTNPFYKDRDVDINTLHLTLLKEKPSIENITKVSSLDYSPDIFTIKKQEVFLFIPGKYHETKLGNTFFERKLQTPATTRNWKTVLKLLELAK